LSTQIYNVDVVDQVVTFEELSYGDAFRWGNEIDSKCVMWKSHHNEYIRIDCSNGDGMSFDARHRTLDGQSCCYLKHVHVVRLNVSIEVRRDVPCKVEERV